VCRDVPAVVLESLLSLSSELASDREVTPVQAWNYIRCRPQFGGLEVGSLARLARKLRDAVKCHGCVPAFTPYPLIHARDRLASLRTCLLTLISNRFGAVIDRRIFENLVVQFLYNGKPF
jgi:hypothetical protein